MSGRRGEAGKPLHRSSLSRQDHVEDALLAAEERKELAARKFDEWVRFKDSFDRGLGLFAKLDPSHCEGESWEKVAVILAAVDRSLGIDLNVAMSNAKQQVGSTQKAKAGPRSMYDAFKKWSMYGHTFTLLKLTATEVESLGAATRQFLEPESDADGAATVLPSLKYHFPPPPARRGLRTRPMTDDQKAMNAIFLRRVRAHWVVANREMREQLAKYVEEAETRFRAKRRRALGLKETPPEKKSPLASSAGARVGSFPEGETESKEESKEREEDEERKEETKTEEWKEQEGESKDRGGEESDGSSQNTSKLIGAQDQQETTSFRLDDSQFAEEDEGFQSRQDRFMESGLIAIGIRRLNELLEDDNDRRKKKENDDRLEKKEEARRAHEGWTRVKDTRRFRLPDEQAFRPGGTWKPPRFDFSGGKGLVRPNKNLIASTTLDIMRGQGMKYAHAISDARQGVEGDLEKSKRQIKRYKETVVQERSIRAAARETHKVQAYREWSRIKAITEAAVRNLRDVDPPAKAAKRAREERWLEVGRALKSVDARLLAEWTTWTGGIFPAAHCQVVWDALQPRSCDTHSASYSATRETFLKLLRPGVDYREAFHKVVRRRLRRAETKRGSRFDEDDELESEDLVLDRRELKYLLTKELGIVMRGEEIRRLIDAFDTTKDRRVRWEDFEKLTGGVREAVRGDTAKRLERRCVWETTCPVTGMPNAYTVSVVKQAGPGGGTGRGGAGHGEQDEQQLRPDTVTTTGTAWGGASEIITLKSGDRRRRNELADRAKHLRILQNYGLQPPSQSRKAGRDSHRGGSKDREAGDYDDDGFEGEDDDSYGEDEFEKSAEEDEGGRRSSPGGGKGSRKNEIGGKVPCEASSWPMSKRTAGLKTLKRLSKENREASELRQLLDEGVAPEPPKFWSAKPGHPDVGDEEEALTEELLLCWRPEPGSPVAFFSLEMSGPEGSKAFCQTMYREIFRDPPDADGDPQYQFWVRALAPNTRYGFRVRAFNGFGPGVYAHQCFATRPARPAVPVAVRIAPTEVLLQWLFNSRNAAKLRELRRVFDALDEHDDGGIGRDELLSALDLDHPHLMALLKDTPAATIDAMEGAGGASWSATTGHNQNRGGKQQQQQQQRGAAIGPATLSAFDMIEASDDEYISWDEIEVHFAHATSGTSGTDRVVGGDRGTTTAQSRRGTGGAHFSVEACTNQERDLWKEVWKGTGGTARVKMLEPGKAYRFRVRPTNCDGLEGAVSESVVVNTMLPAPAALRVHATSGKASNAGVGVWGTRVRLRWDAATGGATATSIGGGGGGGTAMVGLGAGGGGATSDKAATKILMQWANDCSEDEGVSVDMVFSHFDPDGNGTIDPLELGNLLEALGVDVTEERLRQAFTELDCGDDGSVDGALSFDDFEAWWTSTATTFVLMRDDGVAGHLLETAAAVGDPALTTTSPKTTTASFKGRGKGCMVAGLFPNTLYHFRVCTVNNRTRSMLSTPLEVMTAPRRPESPVIIRCHQRSIIVKWYPGAGGAHKYHLQARLLEGLDGVGALIDVNRTTGGGGGGSSRRKAWRTAGGDGDVGWVTVYEGVDSTAKVTGLGANSVYHFRVRAINLRGVASEWSFLAQAATSLRQGNGGAAAGSNYGAGSILCRPHNAAEVFDVDADDDIVVGDTIIFTERLYVDMDGDLITGLGASGGTSPPPPTYPFQDIPMATSGAAPRVSLSTASLGSHSEWAAAALGEGEKWAKRVEPGGGQGRPGTTAARMGETRATCPMEFVGERTAAAYVLQDSFRSMRRKEEGGVLEYSRTKSRNRLLRLEVIWSTVSREEADPFVLPRGSIVERSQGQLSQFETFRALWLQDEKRKSVREEWSLLSGSSGGKEYHE